MINPTHPTTLPSQDIPLCVDLDGTLLKTDTLYESFVDVLKRKPSIIFRIPAWLTKGRAYLKQQLILTASLDVTLLPYTQSFLDFLCNEHEQGRSLALVTATDQTIAQKIADHLGIFAVVLASDGKTNLGGKTKAKRLVEKYGEKGFDYAGNSLRDIPVWRVCRQAIVVNASKTVEKEAKKISLVQKVFPRSALVSRAIWKALRPHQWSKNALIFLPMLMAHHFFDTTLWLKAIQAAIAFSLLSSSLYLVNDLLDLPSDRKHRTKYRRPLAAGDLPIVYAFFLVPILILFSICLALLLPTSFLGLLVLYGIVSAMYSWKLKSIMLVDVIILSSLYTLRLLAGSRATSVPVSFWLLAFSIFFFLSLALVKRVAELISLEANGGQLAPGRSYKTSDRVALTSLGVTSGFLSALVLALYINSQEILALYHLPFLLWLIFPLLLYWVSRIWLLTARGKMTEDPIVFAIKDAVSYVVGALTAALVLLAI